MTVGMVLLGLVIFFVLSGPIGAKVVQRIDNGHWGPARGWFETGYFEALPGAYFVGFLTSVVMSMILAALAAARGLWGAPIL